MDSAENLHYVNKNPQLMVTTTPYQRLQIATVMSSVRASLYRRDSEFASVQEQPSATVNHFLTEFTGDGRYGYR